MACERLDLPVSGFDRKSRVSSDEQKVEVGVKAQGDQRAQNQRAVVVVVLVLLAELVLWVWALVANRVASGGFWWLVLVPLAAGLGSVAITVARRSNRGWLLASVVCEGLAIVAMMYLGGAGN